MCSEEQVASTQSLANLSSDSLYGFFMNSLSGESLSSITGDGTSAFLNTTLTPGDMLCIPVGMWHDVESLPNSIMLNFWFVGRR